MKPQLIIGAGVLALAATGLWLGRGLGQGHGTSSAAPPSAAQSSAAHSPAASTAGPKLAIAKTEFDFGEVKAGEKLEHTFVLKNEGKANLEIKNVVPG
jgi:hypothetical protein